MDRSEGGTKGDEAVTVVIEDDATADDRATGSTRPAEIEERRYVVVETLGRGGMGTVVRAYDPRLRREVALKQLRADVLDSAAEARLVREAQAMAQLSHPNVVAVYDVGRSDRGVEIAMELVEGVTLREWLQRTRRSSEAVLEIFAQAGRGLAAAHAVGLVHRDFKPPNVLVGHDGRVKVTDFGLAKTEGPTSTEDRPSLDGPNEASSELPSLDNGLSSPLTRADTVVGTPAYMAPEQYYGDPLDARTDQYAFCVTLWEALVGEPPFDGDHAQMAAAKAEGPPPWPRSASVSRKVGDAIRRGLAPDQEQRWPSMDALLVAMDLGPSRRSWPLALGVGMVSLAIIGAFGMRPDAPEDQRCQGAPEQLAGIWEAPQRDAVERSLTAAGTSTAPAVLEALDGWTDEWIAGHRDACETSTLRGEQSPATMDLRMGCLTRMRMQLRASTDLLAHADEQIAGKAMDVAQGLPSPSRCEDVARLQSRNAGPSDPAMAQQVVAIEEQLSRVKALDLAGKWDDALTLAIAQREPAIATGHGPIEAQVEAQVGHLQQRQGKLEEAIESTRRALTLALSSGEDELASKAAAVLTYLLSDGVGRTGEAHWMATVALALADRPPTDPLTQGVAHGNLATVLQNRGKLAEAETHRRLALEAFEQGDAPHETAMAHANLAATFLGQGKFEEAEGQFLHALTQYESSLGLDHPDVAHVHSGLGALYASLERLDESLEHLRRAAELFEKGEGPSSGWAMIMRSNMGIILQQQGKPEQAEALIRAALETVTEDGGSNPHLAGVQKQLGLMLHDQERYDEALGPLQDSLATHESTGDAERDDTVELHLAIARTLEALDRDDEALERYERCWDIAQRVELPDHSRASVTFHRHRARWEAQIDRPGAVEAIRAVRAGLSEADAKRPLGAQLDAWIEEHG